MISSAAGVGARREALVPGVGNLLARGYLLCTERTGSQPGHRSRRRPAGGRGGAPGGSRRPLLADSFAKRKL